PPRAPSLSAAASGGGAWMAGGAPATTPGKPGESYEVAVRLVEIAKDARFEMPRADATKGVLKAHWRQHKAVFFPVTGDAARLVTNIARRTSASETQWAMPLGKEGKAWAPDARIWNMNEGSFDQRESLLAPAPGTITFKVNVPQGARMTFAEGTVNATDEATVF